jgi:hypothetical protein
VTASYDPQTNQVLWGTGNPVPWSDPGQGDPSGQHQTELTRSDIP